MSVKLVNPLDVPAGEQRKAIVAGVIAAVLSLTGTISAGGNWWTVASAAVVAGLGAYLGAFQATNDAPSVDEPTGGNMAG